MIIIKYKIKKINYKKLFSLKFKIKSNTYLIKQIKFIYKILFLNQIYKILPNRFKYI